MPHFHAHIIPRRKGDFKVNDDIYDALDQSERDMPRAIIEDSKRQARSDQQMHDEAQYLAEKFEKQ